MATEFVATRYRLEDSIGAGGMGRVWRGVDTVLDRPVAIKVVESPYGLDDVEGGALRARVLREARAAARIDAPECVRVFDVVDDGARAYLVMELVRGVTLAEAVERDGPLAPSDVAAVGTALVAALSAAHRVGIVHRDVKPRNVMMLDGGGVKLADFGIASLKDDPRITSTGLVLGTPSYMSPEQARGRETGPATDVWGLGATLYFAVEGLPPFDRTEALPTLNAVLHEEPRPMQRAGGLGPLLTSLLAKDPATRPSLDRVRAALAGTSTAAATLTAPVAEAHTERDDHLFFASPPPVRPSTRRDSTNRPWVVALGLAGLLAVVAAVVLTRDSESTDTASTASSTSVAPVAAEGTTATTATTPSPSTSLAPPPPEAARGTTIPARVATTLPPGNGAANGAAAGVPADWVAYRHPAVGYELRHPPTWQPRATASSTAVDFHDPATGDYLRVDYRRPPGDDAVAGWEEYAPDFANRHPDYAEITIEPARFDGLEAALWEYTYSGQHATNLAIVTDDTGYALNFQTAEERWDQRADVRQALEDSFRPPV